MISKEEFLALYEKHLSGHCSPEELELLGSYQDELHLDDGQWHHQDTSVHEVRNRILNRLDHSISTPHKLKRDNLVSLKAAAILILLSAVGLLFFKYNTNKANRDLAVAKTPAKTIIHPGGNKAYLVTSSGRHITLGDATQGKLTVQSGIQISQKKNGMLVYQFKNTGEGGGQIGDAFNTIVTPNGGQYQVILSDGTQVWLNAASSLRFPVSFNGNQRRVELTGEGYFEVAKNKEKPFIVQTNTTSVQVLGTHFNVNAYADNNAVSTTLLEGSVRLTRGTETALLKPGQQGVTRNDQQHISVNNTDIEEVMAWKNGYFVFHDENITTIMKQVSRWYDVDIDYADDLVKDREFGGTISKYKDINELLYNMELTHAIHYKIDGRRVTIMK